LTNQVAEVSGFANSMETLHHITIVKAAMAYDHPEMREVIAIIINQALYFGDQLDEILLNPNQIQAHSNKVEDVPKLCGGTSSLISFLEDNLSIPLKLRGIISYFPVRTPTMDGIKNCHTVILTSDAKWNTFSEDQDEGK
jgi:hypothetical protein